MPSLLTSTNYNLIIHTFLSLFLTLLFSFFNISSFLLHGLHTYIHPDDVSPSPSSNGVRAAIRRPGDTTTAAELKPRKKPKDKFEFDENKAQIFRLKLNHNHLQSRLYFDQFRGVFNFTIVACSCLLIHNFLPSANPSGVLPHGTLIPILLGFVGLVRVIATITRVSFDRSASKTSEKQFSILIAFLATLIAFLIVLEVIPNWVFDFNFKSLDGYAKVCISTFIGILAGILHIPATRTARAFWLGTDQIRCNLSIISAGFSGRILLYITYLLTIFTSLLWINPFSDLLIKKHSKQSRHFDQIQHVNNLTGHVGMLRSDFETFRLSCLLATGVFQMLTLRANLQTFLNEAVLSWYQRLHASKLPDLDYSRAKVFLHNHYLCLAALQFFTTPSMVLLFLGLSRIDDNVLDHFPVLCNVIPCSGLVREMALFVAWWVVLIWGVFVSVNLGLYRHGVLYVS